MGITVLCDLCVSTSVTLHRSQQQALESDAQTTIRGHAAQKNQLFDAVAELLEAVAGVDEFELVSELAELAAGAEPSEGFDVSPPDLASLLPFAAAGFAEE